MSNLHYENTLLNSAIIAHEISVVKSSVTHNEIVFEVRNAQNKEKQ